MQNYIFSFCDEFGYPEKGKKVLENAHRIIQDNASANELFYKYIFLYNKDELEDYDSAFLALEEVARLTEIHTYTVQLLFFICLSKHTRKMYQDKLIPYEIFRDSMSDMRWKLWECYNMYGIWGSFVAFWFPGFFNLTRFALGRLQFETDTCNVSYSNGDYNINEGDKVINMHIPSCGPLTEEACMESYKKAYEFYRPLFKSDIIPFVCDSWLLYPRHTEFLPKDSNIRKFMDHFTIIDSDIDDKYSDLWRIFYKEYHQNIDDMPKNTSLQRAYIDWIKQGNPVGSGYGIFFFDGNQIVR